jgi:hypothetical protein
MEAGEGLIVYAALGTLQRAEGEAQGAGGGLEGSGPLRGVREAVHTD